MTEFETVSHIGYLDRLDLYKKVKPYASALVPYNTPGAKASNLSVSFHEVNIGDIRHSPEEFSTDVQGFELTKFPTSLTGKELRSQACIHEKYYPEAEEYLKRKFNSQIVCIFDATVRDAGPNLLDSYDAGAELRSEQVMGTAWDAHVDQTPHSTYSRLKRIFPDNFEDMKKRHVRIINIWRPLVEPLQHRPLALCDWRTTRQEDYVPCDLPSPGYIGESFQVHRNPAHKWWFASNMMQEEVLLIKMFDSWAGENGQGIALCTPHCAFSYEDAPKDCVPRESMEIRAIIID